MLNSFFSTTVYLLEILPNILSSMAIYVHASSFINIIDVTFETIVMSHGLMIKGLNSKTLKADELVGCRVSV
jgi:hypothetical protein